MTRRYAKYEKKKKKHGAKKLYLFQREADHSPFLKGYFRSIVPHKGDL